MNINDVLSSRYTRSLVAMISLTLSLGCTTTSTTTTDAAPTPENIEPEIQEAASINLQLGVGYMKAGRFDIARSKLIKALDYDPTLAEAHNALGVLYEGTSAGLQAEEHYRKALELKPDYPLARMNFGRLLCAAGASKASEGEQQFLTVLGSGDIGVEEIAYTGAGVCARARGDLNQADIYFNKALQANPYAAGTLLEMATLNYDRNRYEQARQFLQRYHKQAGYNAGSLNLAIRIEEALGDTQQRDEYSRLLRTRFADS